jgi:predicted small lipoprotein YifL
MKKLLTVLIMMLMVLSLAGCGSKKQEEVPVEQPTEVTEPEEPVEETVSDEDLAASLAADLVGTWNYSSIEQEKLVFNNDGTGTYNSINNDDLTFNYQVTVEHRTYANGDPYDSYILNMDYSNGEKEQNIFWFQNDEHNMFALHDYEDGGYNGVLQFNEYTKK